ncbi:uncharacterized protein LOC111339221 isoform X4 [Stylophora pistillata]|uniref:uncharacterized protein LOC111339221 isoform X4 n=1 Tax=Stylophora pistillata TaxID=50429 RepID=UPI000C04797C|nr:uncharacterized protein LOC111339221 isoform X4 [Stylophora pistillata]
MLRNHISEEIVKKMSRDDRKELFCGLCSQLASEPLRTAMTGASCTHVFCDACVQRLAIWESPLFFCPRDGQRLVIKEFQPDDDAEGKICSIIASLKPEQTGDRNAMDHLKRELVEGESKHSNEQCHISFCDVAFLQQKDRLKDTEIADIKAQIHGLGNSLVEINRKVQALKQQHADHDRIRALENQQHADRDRIQALENQQHADHDRIQGLENQQHADHNERIQALENQQHADRDRIQALENQVDVLQNRCADTDAELMREKDTRNIECAITYDHITQLAAGLR